MSSLPPQVTILLTPSCTILRYVHCQHTVALHDLGSSLSCSVIFGLISPSTNTDAVNFEDYVTCPPCGWMKGLCRENTALLWWQVPLEDHLDILSHCVNWCISLQLQEMQTNKQINTQALGAILESYSNCQLLRSFMSMNSAGIGGLLTCHLCGSGTVAFSLSFSFVWENYRTGCVLVQI